MATEHTALTTLHLYHRTCLEYTARDLYDKGLCVSRVGCFENVPGRVLSTSFPGSLFFMASYGKKTDLGNEVEVMLVMKRAFTFGC